MTKLIKNKTEIAGIKKSCQGLAQVMEVVSQHVKIGVSTEELEKVAEQKIAELGGRPAFKNYRTSKKARPFPTALCTSLNDDIVHCPAIPGKILQSGDIIGIDMGMELNGYYSDMAVTFAVGKISKEAKRLLQVTQHSLELGIAQIKPGNTLDSIGRAIQNYVEAHGFSVVRDLVGHGVGLDVHEDPQIPHYAIAESGLPNMELQAGMVIAVEPMVNIGDWRIKVGKDGFTFQTADDSLSAHFEHTILITPDGHEVLTKLAE